jgi:hypothetical protein
VGEWLEAHPAALQALLAKALASARAAEAARKARELVRRQSALAGRTTLPGKLADCSSETGSEGEGMKAGCSSKKGLGRGSEGQAGGLQRRDFRRGEGADSPRREGMLTAGFENTVTFGQCISCLLAYWRMIRHGTIRV